MTPKERLFAILDGKVKDTARKTPTQWEHSLQVGCITWLKLQYPNVVVWATPNGAFCGVKQARKLKAEGMVSGVPDLFIPMARKGYHGLFVEMKNGKKGRVSEEQMAMMIRLRKEGYQCAVCRSLEEFIKIIKDYFELGCSHNQSPAC